MGNCMETEKGKEEESEVVEIGGKEVKFVKDVGNKSKGVRVKMVLTKEELQLLMLQLRNRSGSGVTRIEDVLEEIGKARNRVRVDDDDDDDDDDDESWKPTLDCITEIPEMLEMIR